MHTYLNFIAGQKIRKGVLLKYQYCILECVFSIPKRKHALNKVPLAVRQKVLIHIKYFVKCNHAFLYFK